MSLLVGFISQQIGDPTLTLSANMDVTVCQLYALAQIVSVYSYEIFQLFLRSLACFFLFVDDRCSEQFPAGFRGNSMFQRASVSTGALEQRNLIPLLSALAVLKGTIWSRSLVLLF